MDIFSVVKKAQQTADVWVTEGLFEPEYRTYFEKAFVSVCRNIALQSITASIKESSVPAKGHIEYVCWLGYEAGKEFLNGGINVPNPTNPTEETGEWGDIAVEDNTQNPTNPTEETGEWEDIAVEV